MLEENKGANCSTPDFASKFSPFSIYKMAAFTTIAESKALGTEGSQ